jgi:hypothetical protein
VPRAAPPSSHGLVQPSCVLLGWSGKPFLRTGLVGVGAARRRLVRRNVASSAPGLFRSV